MSELLNKLAHIQRELKAPKNQFNSFGKYHYRSCEDILEAVKPLLDGLIMFIDDTIIMLGNRYYVKATITITDGTETHSVSAWAREEDDKKGMDASQITGAASSYARKYACNGMFLIDDTKDADTKDNTKKEEKKEPPKKEVSPETKTDNFIPSEVNERTVKGGKIVYDITGPYGKYSTFSESFAKSARDAIDNQLLIGVTYKTNQYGNTATNVGPAVYGEGE